MNLIASFVKPYQAFDKNIWLLALITFIFRTGAMFLFFSSLYFSYLGFNTLEIGYLLSSYGFGCIAGSYLGGILTAKYGAQRVLSYGFLACALAFTVLPFIAIYHWLLVMLFIAGVTERTLRPTLLAATSILSSHDNLASANALIRQATSVGTVIGPAICGFLAHYSFIYLFIINVSACLVAFCLFRFTVYDKLSVILFTSTQKEQDSIIHNTKPFNVTSESFIIYLLIVFIAGIVYWQLLTTAPLYFEDILHITPKSFGLLLAFNGITIILTEVHLIKFMEDRFKTTTIIATGLFIMGFSFATLITIKHLWDTYFMILLLTIGESLILPSLAKIIPDLTRNKNNNGKAYGMQQLAWSASMAIAPLIGNTIIHHFHYNTLWISLFIISFFGVVLVILLNLKINQYYEASLNKLTNNT